ncbi:MAG TPA: helicase SNF2, partial [Clostridia bacterium]|nr:helicase SNF2 [Clostridia bacterium]
MTDTPFAFSFEQADIDHILRLGSNTDNCRTRIAAEYMKGKPLDTIAEFFKAEYHGGFGLKTERGNMSAWYAEDGIHLARGNGARYVKSAQVIPWRDVAERISELMEQGQFATNVELAETESNTRRQLAQSLWYLRQDFSENAIEQSFLSTMDEFRGGGFPDETQKLADALAQPKYLAAITREFEQFRDAYHADRHLLRFNFHHVDDLLSGLQDLSHSWREYSTDMAALPDVAAFITEDEINDSIAHGSSVEGGKGRLYEYFKENHTTQEQVAFLKNEYGIGGRSHAVSRSSGSNENHSSKGISLKKTGCTEIQLAWSNVAKRISDLIRQNRYFTTKEQDRYDEIQREKAVQVQETASVSSYSDYASVKDAHAGDIVLYQVGDFFELYGADAEAAAEVLDLNLSSRNIPDVGRVPLCGIPSNRLEQYVEKLQDAGHSITVSGIEQQSGERRVFNLPTIEHEATQPTVSERIAQFKPVVIAAVSEDVRYRNACGHSDRENAEIECNAAVQRAVLNSGDMELIRQFSDVPEFRSGLHQEVFDDTYPRLHELLRPLSQDDIDAALRSWNGDIASKRRVQDYMTDHARDKDTAAWLSREYGNTDTKSLFIIRAGSPEGLELPWAKVQRYLAQLVREDRFFTEPELDSFADIDAAAVRESLNTPEAERRVDDMLAQAKRIAAESAVPSYERFSVIETGNGYAIWDDLHDSYYVDDVGVTEHFTSEWQTEDYLNEVRKAVAEQDAADWLAVERSKVTPEVEAMPPERMEQIAEAFEAAGFHYDDINSYGGYLVFLEEGGNPYTFESWEEAADWIDGVVFDDPARSIAAERVMHPERFEQVGPAQPAFKYSVGDTVYLEDGKPFIVEEVTDMHVQLRDPTLYYPIWRSESRESFARLMERYPQPDKDKPARPEMTTETVAV